MRELTKKQKHVLATLGVLASTGVMDISWHGGPWGFIGVGFVTIATGVGGDIVFDATKRLVMGDEVAKVDEAIRTSVQPEDMHEDQRAFSKIKRLLNFGEGWHSMPKEESPQIVEAQKQEMPEIPRNAEKNIQRQFKGNTTEQPFPQYPDDETLKLGEVVASGARFDPHINMLFGQGMIASAVQGSGKSMLNGVIIEQAGKCGVPIIIFDHKGEYAPIVDLPFINGLRAGSASLRAKIGNGCFELTENNADDFVQLVMSPDEHGEYRQAIIHLPSYGDAWVDRASVVAEVGQALMRRSTRLREQGIEPIPCLILMDEAQLYIPQNVDLLPPEARENKKTLSSLNNAYFALVSNGRSNGYTVLFATQSLTYIAKWAIKSCQIRVFMRHTEKNDLDMCGDIIDRSVATREEIEALPKGTGVVFGFTMKPMVVHFDKKQSQDKSETPGLDRLRKRQAPKQQQIPGLNMEALPFKAAPVPTMPSGNTTLNLDTVLALAGKISDEALLKLIDKLPDVNRDEQEDDEDLEFASNSNASKLTALHRQVLEHYRHGIGLRKLGELIGTGKDKAGDLKRDLIKWGFLEDDNFDE